MIFMAKMTEIIYFSLNLVEKLPHWYQPYELRDERYIISNLAGGIHNVPT